MCRWVKISYHFVSHSFFSYVNNVMNRENILPEDYILVRIISPYFCIAFSWIFSLLPSASNIQAILICSFKCHFDILSIPNSNFTFVCLVLFTNIFYLFPSACHFLLLKTNTFHLFYYTKTV